MSDDPIDLGPLDPTRDPARFDARVRAVMAAAAPGLARRRARPAPIATVAAWWRPVLAAAAALALAAGAWLARADAARTAATESEWLALGVPEAFAQGLASGGTPEPAVLGGLTEGR